MRHVGISYPNDGGKIRPQNKKFVTNIISHKEPSKDQSPKQYFLQSTRDLKQIIPDELYRTRLILL